MQITKSSWHYRLYQFNDHLTGQLTDTHQWRDPRVWNLCSYMRGILVWLPLKLVLYLCYWGFPIYTLFVIPSRLWGFDYWIFWGVIALTGTVILGGGIGLGMLAEKYRGKEREPKKPSEFKVLFKSWMWAMKESLCPVVEVKDEKN